MKNEKGKTPKRPNGLTVRQGRILSLICKELSPAEISKRLKISTKTFFNHRARIVEKTHAKSNIGLYKYALRHGYAKLAR
jgi:DNA-binding CsgD family transcriptional regulator